jgi:hypothetical protein
MGKTYGTSTGFKVLCWVMAVICAVFIVLIPMSALLLWLAYGSRIETTDEHLVIKWFGTRRIAWGDFAELRWARGGGLVGALMKPVTYQLKSKPGGAPRFAVGAYQNSQEILDEIQRRTGLTVQS